MIYLREICRDDVEIINSWRNDPNISKTLCAPFRYVNVDTDIHWYESYLKNRQNQVRCAVCDTDKGIVGIVNLLNIDSVSKNSELSIIIGHDFQNQGYGKKATIEMLHHAFYNLNLHKVYLYVLQNNFHALRLYESIGFLKEGLLREYVYKMGSYHNLLIMGIFQSEFRAEFHPSMTEVT